MIIKNVLFIGHKKRLKFETNTFVYTSNVMHKNIQNRLAIWILSTFTYFRFSNFKYKMNFKNNILKETISPFAFIIRIDENKKKKDTIEKKKKY